MPSSVRRQCAWRTLSAAGIEFALVREVESHLHASALNEAEYLDFVRRACANLRLNPTIGLNTVRWCDDQVAEGTILQHIEQERQKRASVFKAMLREKYESLNDKEFTAIVKCRRCGGVDISHDEKQTRSADEAATIFCQCNRCGLRWVVR